MANEEKLENPLECYEFPYEVKPKKCDRCGKHPIGKNYEIVVKDGTDKPLAICRSCYLKLKPWKKGGFLVLT